MDSSMDPVWERWNEVNHLFDQVIDLPADEQARHLADICGADRELHDAVAALIAADTESAGMFERLHAASAEAALTERAGAADSPAVQQIGQYRILREIGRGGMGTIYLGERVGADFRQTVAVKVLRRGIDTDDVVRRFISERRILAELTHPNIAGLIDGGATPDGAPYLVMEHVEGTHITAYGDEHSLSVRQRLELFLVVADAVR